MYRLRINVLGFGKVLTKHQTISNGHLSISKITKNSTCQLLENKDSKVPNKPTEKVRNNAFFLSCPLFIKYYASIRSSHRQVDEQEGLTAIKRKNM